MENKERFVSLDVLKFISAVLIIFHHYQQVFNVVFPNFNFFSGRIYFGYLVELFFIISGFLEAYTHKDKETFISFFIKKIIRILPMVIISTTFAYIICLFYYNQTGLVICNTINVWEYICNCLLIFQNGIFDLNFYGVNNPLWYMSILLMLYCIHYIEMYISKKTRINVNFIYLFILILFIYVKQAGINVPIFNDRLARGLIPFNIGCLLFFINNKLKNTNINILSFVGIILLGIISIVDESIIFYDLQKCLTYCIYPLIVIFCLNSKILNKLINHKVGRGLGKISFETYIWHSPIFSAMIIINNYTNIFPLQKRWFMFFTALVIVLLSTLMYYFVEKPITTKLLDIYYRKYKKQ